LTGGNPSRLTAEKLPFVDPKQLGKANTEAGRRGDTSDHYAADPFLTDAQVPCDLSVRDAPTTSNA
jgi:hypothetical protein